MRKHVHYSNIADIYLYLSSVSKVKLDSGLIDCLLLLYYLSPFNITITINDYAFPFKYVMIAVVVTIVILFQFPFPGTHCVLLPIELDIIRSG